MIVIVFLVCHTLSIIRLFILREKCSCDKFLVHVYVVSFLRGTSIVILDIRAGVKEKEGSESVQIDRVGKIIVAN